MLRKYEKIQDDRKAHRKQMICLTGTFGFPDRKKLGYEMDCFVFFMKT